MIRIMRISFGVLAVVFLFAAGIARSDTRTTNHKFSCPRGTFDTMVSETEDEIRFLGTFATKAGKVISIFDVIPKTEEGIRDFATKLLLFCVFGGSGAPLSAGAGGHPTPLFETDTQWNFQAGLIPSLALLADLDNNGNVDAAIANFGSDEVTVALLDTDGSANVTHYPTGNGPDELLIGDFDGVNGPDLVTVNAFDRNLSLLLNAGDGTFGAATPIAAGSNPFDATAGKFDDDPHLDIVSVDGAIGEIVLLFGNGDGSFAAPQVLSAADFPGSVVSADMNGDDNLDLVTNGSIRLGDGEGAFAPPISFTPNFSVSFVFVGKLDSDPHLDLATVNRDNSTMATFLGNGDGTLGPPDFYVTGNLANRVAIADAGTFPANLFVSHEGDEILLHFAGRGDGTFEGNRAYPAVPNLGSRLGADGVAIADFDRNGAVDVLATSEFTDAAVLPGNGDATLDSRISISGQRGTRVVAGLFDADLDPDLVFTRRGALDVRLGNGDFTFGNPVTLPLPGDSDTHAISTAFVDAGTTVDLLVSDASTNEVSVFLGNGNGGFAAQPTVPVGISPRSIASGLFNDDAHLDLVVASRGDFAQMNGSVSVALGNGDGSFAPASTLISGIEGDSIATGDWNQDGEVDLALVAKLQAFTPTIEIFLGNGDGSFQSPSSLGLGSSNFASGLFAEDLNLDGFLDLAITQDTSTLSIFFGKGDGSFEPTPSQIPSSGGHGVPAALDSAPIPEIVVATGNGLVAVLDLDRRDLSGCAAGQDRDGDGVCDDADNCVDVANGTLGTLGDPAAQSFQTTTGGQLDDDADGFGNACDAKFGTGGLVVSGSDVLEHFSSFNKDREGQNCGTDGQTPCAQFDLDNNGKFISGSDIGRTFQLFNRAPGPKCDACPLPCDGANCP